MKSKKALYNIVTEFFYQFVAIICSFILPKIVLNAYGSEYNGIIQSITQFLSYISILTLGISGSTRIAIYKAKGDIVKISKVVKATQCYMKKVTFAFIGYVVFLSLIYPLIIKSDISNLDISLLVLIIGIGTLFEYAFGVTYSALISALQSKYIYNIILIILKIISTTLSVILIYNNHSIFVVKLVGSICFALGPIILNKIVNKKFKIITDIEPSKEALSQKKEVMSHSIANCVHEYTDVLLLSLFTSAKTVSVYSIYNLVLGGIRKIQTMFTNGLEGAFGDMWAKGEYKEYEKNFNTFEFLMYSLVSVLIICTTFLLLPFIKIYTKGVNDINYIIPTFAYMSILATATICIRTPYVIAVQSAGKYKETKNGAIIEAITNVIISLILVFPFGLVGVTIGTLVANVFRTIQYEMFISKNLVKRTNLIFVKRIIILLICFFCSSLIINYFPINNIESLKQWIVSGIVYFGISLLVTTIVSRIFFKNDYKNSLTILRKMLKKKGKRS